MNPPAALDTAVHLAMDVPPASQPRLLPSWHHAPLPLTTGGKHQVCILWKEEAGQE